MLISAVTSRNSPGASTTALALTMAWPRPAILAECDPRGGDVQWGLARGENIGSAGLLRLQLAARRNQSMSESVWEEVVALPGIAGDDVQKYWLPGLLNPREAGSIDWVGVARALSASGVDVIADCGTVFGDPVRAPRAIWNSADVVVLPVRSTMLGVRIGQIAASVLQADLMLAGLGADRLGSVVVQAPGGYPTKQVAAELEATAPMLGSLPDDPVAAQQLAGFNPLGKRFSRTPLMKAAVELAQVLGARGESVEALSSSPPSTSAGSDHVRPRPATARQPLASHSGPTAHSCEAAQHRGQNADRRRPANRCTPIQDQ
jgi:hypothetical protein